MLRELQNHPKAYAVLLIMLVGFVLLFMGSWPDRTWQRIWVLVLMVLYPIWGAVTHLHSKHITSKIVYEYIGMSIVAGSILLLVTL